MKKTSKKTTVFSQVPTQPNKSNINGYYHRKVYIVPIHEYNVHKTTHITSILLHGNKILNQRAIMVLSRSPKLKKMTPTCMIMIMW